VSDDAIDYDYEEQLKAEMGYRELWVRFANDEEVRVKTFPDTAKWDTALQLVIQDLLADPDIVEVWTDRMGAGTGEASVSFRQPAPIRGRGGAGERPDGSPGVATARVASPPPCCEPMRYAGPSGVRLRHASSCRFRGEPYVAQVESPPRLLERNVNSARRLARIHRSETRRTGLGLDVPSDAGGVLTLSSNGSGCPAHPSEPLDTCIVCSERRV
jgi:hypothetical protein